MGAMTVLEGVNTLLTLLTTATNMMAQAQQISALVQKAQSEGRTTFTDAEWGIIQQFDQNSRQALVAAITAALTAPTK